MKVDSSRRRGYRRHERLLPGQRPDTRSRSSTGRPDRRLKRALPMPAKFRSAIARHAAAPASRRRPSAAVHGACATGPAAEGRCRHALLDGEDARNCTAERYAINKSRMLRLADYSRLSLGELRAEAGIAYDERMQGTLQLFRHPGAARRLRQGRQGAGRRRHPLRGSRPRRLPSRRAGAEACRRSHRRRPPHPKDETGDCFKFTGALAAKCVQMGVVFDYQRTIKAIQVDGGEAQAVVTDRGVVRLRCCRRSARQLLTAAPEAAWHKLASLSVKGYSLTIPITDASRAPESTVVDETYKIADHTSRRPHPCRGHGRDIGLYERPRAPPGAGRSSIP